MLTIRGKFFILIIYKITFKKCLCTESIKLFTFVGYNR